MPVSVLAAFQLIPSMIELCTIVRLWGIGNTNRSWNTQRKVINNTNRDITVVNIMMILFWGKDIIYHKADIEKPQVHLTVGFIIYSIWFRYKLANNSSYFITNIYTFLVDDLDDNEARFDASDVDTHTSTSEGIFITVVAK